MAVGEDMSEMDSDWIGKESIGDEEVDIVSMMSDVVSGRGAVVMVSV
jgi:hypothetical protein